MTEVCSTNYIDSHVHLWTSDRQNYPLAPGFTGEELACGAFSPEHIIHVSSPSGVKRIVLVQMSYYGFDNSYMLDVIRQWPGVFGGIAVINWNASHPEKTMGEFAKQGVRGFRIYPDSGAASTWLNKVGFTEMFTYGADEHLALCPLIEPDALPSIVRQCKKYPRTPIVIDHLAGIGSDGNLREEDINALCSLAHFPQVWVKLSGFYALGNKRPPHLELVPLIKRIYEAFGARRLMWGSDCPFQILGGTYEDAFSLVHDHLDFLSSEDRSWILGQTAADVFFR